MRDLLPVLETIGGVLGVWTLVSIATGIALIPWFRAQARANEALSRRYRNDDWMVAELPANVRLNVTR
jgi:hypothetical protein